MVRSSVTHSINRARPYDLQNVRVLLVAACSAFVTLSPAMPFWQEDKSVEPALAAARARAAAGDVIAQFSLGALLSYGSDETAVAVDWFRKSALQDYAPAEFQMGQLYDFGFGVEQNVGEALVWYRKAANH